MTPAERLREAARVRPTLADVIAAELERSNFLGWLLTQGNSALWERRTPEQEMARVVAHFVREHIRDQLADELLVQSIGLHLALTEGYNYACEGDRSAARAVLALVAEHLEAS